MTYKSILIAFFFHALCLPSYGMEDEIETIMKRIIKTHAEHNDKFNRDYERLRDISRENMKKRVQKEKEEKTNG